MFQVYLVIGNDNFYIEEKIKEISKNIIFYSFKENNKNNKASEKNLEIINEILKNLNYRLFSFKEDIALRNLEALKDEEKEKLLHLIKISKGVKFFLIFNDEKKFQEFKILLNKNGIKFKEINLLLKWANQFKKIIEEELQKLKIKPETGFIETLYENYKNNFSLFLQDIKKIKYYKGEKEISLEEFKSFLQLTTNEFQIQEAFLSLNFPLFLRRFKKYIYSLQSEDYKKRKENVEKIIYNLLFGALLKIYFMKMNKEKSKIEGNPFYLQKLRSFSDKLDYKKIKNLIKALALTDKKIKKFYLQYKEVPEEITLNFLLLQKSD
jgi:DNA polymerase III delta subunit